MTIEIYCVITWIFSHNLCTILAVGVASCRRRHGAAAHPAAFPNGSSCRRPGPHPGRFHGIHAQSDGHRRVHFSAVLGHEHDVFLGRWEDAGLPRSCFRLQVLYAEFGSNDKMPNVPRTLNYRYDDGRFSSLFQL